MRTVKRYWVFQFHVMLEGSSMVKVTDVVVPDVETLPVPVHPVHTYRVSVASGGQGQVTFAAMDVPESNHSLVSAGEP